ncbi:hypothetical protein GCM10027169_27230 [Gordonia jinhuaensis]|uniref:Phosphatidic acid phosphatase type 2/haloperoxidase domain-containing protein n=1 Tax=Gordonia jinhuaensis TaxID=1517702 RepID=A0A916TAG4_9ACTN|nr:phosphatase PAP2 family protein [Gordonia jinhuaensis]GGB37889.1 hypothetical protein GCM10011489_27090 [Gordonia jinhuaensis]
MSAVLGRIAGAVVLLAAMVAVYVVAVRTAAGQRLDERWLLTLRGTEAHNDLPNAVGLGSVTDPRLWVVAILAIVALGLAARRRLSIIVLLILPVAVIVCARLLRDGLLTRPDLIASQFPHINTFPSGHAAAAAGCVAAIIRAAPRVVQPLIVLAGTMWLTLVSQDLMVWGWHRPSDLIGSILLAGALAILVPNSPSRTLGTWWQAAILVVASVIAPVGWAAYIAKPVVALVGVVAAVVLTMLFVGRETARGPGESGTGGRWRIPGFDRSDMPAPTA